MNRIARPVLLALAMLVFCAGSTSAEFAPKPSAVSLSGAGAFGLIDRNFSPMATPVHYACRRNCTFCRDDCYNAYRINCFHGGCRQQFVLCMRGCWYEICRACRTVR